MIACSSTKAKYKALADSIADFIRLQYLLSDLQISPSSAPAL